MELLQGLKAEHLAIAGVIIILREVFSFLKSKQIGKSQDHDDNLVHTLERINENIEANTELTRELVSRVKETDRKVEGIRGELDDLRAEFRRRPTGSG